MTPATWGKLRMRSAVARAETRRPDKPKIGPDGDTEQDPRWRRLGVKRVDLEQLCG